MAVAVAYDAEVVDTAEVAVEQYAVAKGEKLPGIIPAQLADTLGGVGLGIGVFLYVVELVDCIYSLKSGPVSHSKMGHPRERTKLIK